MVTQKDKYIELAALFRVGLTGNQIAYAQFLEHITPLLMRMVARKLPACDVDDVVQEILISVHKARHTYDGKRPIMPWLTSIAKFRIADYLRKHYREQRHQAIDIEELEECLSDTNQTGNESKYTLDEALEGVPENHKKIITLMHGYGYTAKEVGQQMNMNTSAVKVAAHRALKKIRERF